MAAPEIPGIPNPKQRRMTMAKTISNEDLALFEAEESKPGV